jgi:DNA-binding NtrC family response regulator
MNSAKTPTIFIVEDDRFYGEIIKNELEQNNYTQVELHTSGDECINNLYKMPDIILLDYHLEGSLNGIEVLKKIKAFNPDAQVIMLSGQEELNVAVNSLKYGAFDYVVKKDGALAEMVALLEKIASWNAVIDKEKSLKKKKVLMTLSATIILGLFLAMQTLSFS